MEFSTRVGTIGHQEKVLKQVAVVHDIKGAIHRKLLIHEAVQVYDVIINKSHHCCGSRVSFKVAVLINLSLYDNCKAGGLVYNVPLAV